MLTRKISASSYLKFRTCPRLYYWEHIIGAQRAKEDGARRFGTMFHKGLEEWWRFMSTRMPWDDADEALVLALKGIDANAKHVATDPYEVAKAEALMTAYHARYFEEEFSAPMEINVEIYFAVPLVDEDHKEVPGWLMTGRNDAMADFKDRRRRVVEHKTTSDDIGIGSDYWARLSIDTQSSMYIMAARRAGHDVDQVLYDVAKKPGERPGKATPVEKQKFTVGKGCPTCGGRKSKTKAGPVIQGTGRIMMSVDDGTGRVSNAAEVACPGCNGTGWDTAPALNAKQRVVDEPPADFKMRLMDELASEPDAYFRQGNVSRDEQQLRECAADLTVTTGEIETLYRWSESAGKIESLEARRKWPRNTQACTNIFNRRCDFIDVCAGTSSPWASPLYKIRARTDAPAAIVEPTP